MSSKLLLKFLGGCLALFIVMGIAVDKTDAAPAGVTEEPSSQLIIPFDEREAEGNGAIDKNTSFQLTNTSRTTDVVVHIQLLYSPGCNELDFFDTLTAEDTHLYELDGLTRNDGATGPGFDGTNFDSHGVVVVTPVVSASVPQAIAFNNLHAEVNWHYDDSFDSAYRFNAVGRDAIDIASGVKLQDGTPIDGVVGGFERIIPDDIIYHYDTTNYSGGPTTADLIFVAISDDFLSVDRYKATGGTTSLMSVENVVDADENSISCGDVQFSCMEIAGINDDIPSTLASVTGNCGGDPADDVDCKVICNQTDYDVGWDKLVQRNVVEADAVIGIIGLTTSDEGGAAHMFVQ